MKNEKVNKIVKIILYVAIVSFLLYAIGVKFYIVLSEGVPREYREMNSVQFANEFANGNNLYDDELNSETPFATNMYGVVMPLVISPFIKCLDMFTALSVLQISQLVTLIFEVVGIVMFYYLILKKTRNHILSAFASDMLFVCYWRYSPLGGAFPDSYGLTLTILIMYLIVRNEIKARYYVMLYVLITIILFYTKQYFAFIACGVFVYLWINLSFKKAFLYFISGISLGAVSILLVNRKFDYYFTETLPMAQGQTSTEGWDYSLIQIVQLSKGPFLLVSIMTVILIITIIAICVVKKEVNLGSVFVWNNEQKSVSYEMVQIFCIFPFVAYFAQNGGTSLTYYLQMWYPYVIVCGVITISIVIKYLKEYKKQVWIVGIYIFIGISIVSTKSWIITPRMSLEMRDNWNMVYAILDEYSEQGDILVSPHLSAYCIENDIYTSDYGQAQFNGLVNYLSWDNSKIWKKLFPETGRIIECSWNHHDIMKQNVEEGKYSCIAITDYYEYYSVLIELMDKKYVLLDEFPLQTGGQVWNTLIYIAK